ncbi:MAG: PD40 domain-containing protein [Deltaproteobacteria bacterium]|nr:PD40 domain-containing protein [Deltaproteobacteria bacterium]MBW2534481.1 PD40 domain-containing protein [Deltaproteobacteria bacterium]
MGGRKRTNLTADHDRDDWQPAISYDGERIAFRSERDGGGIFVMGATGESVRRVTDFGYHPAWSPDGKSLVVGSTPVPNPMARGAVSEAWLVDVESGDKSRIDAGEDAVGGCFSPDGREIVFSRWKTKVGSGLFRVPREGGKPQTLFDAETGRGWGPHWSVDGRFVYFASMANGVANIWRMPMSAGAATSAAPPEPVTAGVSAWADAPTVSADGKRLLFRVSTTRSNVAKVRFDAKKERVVGEPIALTRGQNGYCYVDVSPDGESIVMSECRAILPDVEENVFVTGADGRSRRALTYDQGKVSRLPRWTVDGKRILFYSNRSGDYEAWSVEPDGSGLRQLTDTPGETLLFTVPAPDGKRAVSWINMGGMVVIDTLQTKGKPLERIEPYPDEELQCLPTSWSPDGKWIAGQLDPTGGVCLYSLDEKVYQKITDDGGGPEWLPDSKRLLYFATSGVHVIDIHERKPRLVMASGLDGLADYSLSPDGEWLYLLQTSQDDDIWLAELE